MEVARIPAWSFSIEKLGLGNVRKLGVGPGNEAMLRIARIIITGSGCIPLCHPQVLGWYYVYIYRDVAQHHLYTG